jgi:hypothetical protein
MDSLDLRCHCSRRPLLGRAVKVDNKWFLHVKIFKSGKIYGEMWLENGRVRLRCRECLRWLTVTVKPVPAMIDEEASSEMMQVLEKRSLNG